MQVRLGGGWGGLRITLMRKVSEGWVCARKTTAEECVFVFVLPLLPDTVWKIYQFDGAAMRKPPVSYPNGVSATMRAGRVRRVCTRLRAAGRGAASG